MNKGLFHKLVYFRLRILLVQEQRRIVVLLLRVLRQRHRLHLHHCHQVMRHQDLQCLLIHNNIRFKNRKKQTKKNNTKNNNKTKIIKKRQNCCQILMEWLKITVAASWSKTFSDITAPSMCQLVVLKTQPWANVLKLSIRDEFLGNIKLCTWHFFFGKQRFLSIHSGKICKV